MGGRIVREPGSSQEQSAKIWEHVLGLLQPSVRPCCPQTFAGSPSLPLDARHALQESAKARLLCMVLQDSL